MNDWIDLVELLAHTAVSLVAFWFGWHLRGKREAGK